VTEPELKGGEEEKVLVEGQGGKVGGGGTSTDRRCQIIRSILSRVSRRLDHARETTAPYGGDENVKCRSGQRKRLIDGG